MKFCYSNVIDFFEFQLSFMPQITNNYFNDLSADKQIEGKRKETYLYAKQCITQALESLTLVNTNTDTSNGSFFSAREVLYPSIVLCSNTWDKEERYFSLIKWEQVIEKEDKDIFKCRVFSVR